MERPLCGAYTGGWWEGQVKLRREVPRKAASTSRRQGRAGERAERGAGTATDGAIKHVEAGTVGVGWRGRGGERKTERDKKERERQRERRSMHRGQCVSERKVEKREG